MRMKRVLGATQSDPRSPNAGLVKDAAQAAPLLARVWPRPHAQYFAMEPARRKLAQLAALRAGALAPALGEALSIWALRRLVAQILPEAPRGLVEALRKLAPGPFPRADQDILIAVLAHGGQGAKTLRHVAEITPALLAILKELPDPLRRARIVACLETARQAKLLTQAAALAARRETGGVLRVAARLERACSRERLFRMLIEAIGLERLAPPPIPGARWFQPLASAAAIRRAALRFKNCLEDRIPMLLAGEAAYYEVIAEEPAIVEVVRLASGVWVLGEVRGHANATIHWDLHRRIQAHLQAHGAVEKPGPHPLARALAMAARLV